MDLGNRMLILAVFALPMLVNVRWRRRRLIDYSFRLMRLELLLLSKFWLPAPGMFAKRNQCRLTCSQKTIPMGYGIAASREDPKILRVDDAEIVGDGRRELVEPLRHGLAQEAEHDFGEVAEFGVALVVGDVLVHHLPEPFDRVEVRTVGRHEMQDDAPPRLLQPVLDGSGMVVAGVVEENVDAAHRRTGLLQRLEQGDRARRIDG